MQVIRGLLRFPVELLRFIRGFVSPPRKTGRIALGRFVIVIQIVAAAIFLGYTLNKKSISVPFLSSSKYEVQVEFPDAKGLDPADSPAAAVAGTPEGQVTDVSYDNGRALVTLSLDSSVRGKLFADATAQLRPASALQNLLVNIDPGHPGAGPLPDDRPIEPSHTSAFVAIDELTGILDSDTQAYVSILLKEADEAVNGREGQLRGALRKLARLTDPVQTISRTLAERRVLLTRLVGDLDRVFTTLAKRGNQLTTVIEDGNRTLAVTDARAAELAAATRRLAPVLIQTQRTLAALRRLSVPLVPALDILTPASAPLANGLAKLHGLLPRVKALVGEFKSLERRSGKPLALLLRGTHGLSGNIRALEPTARKLVTLARLLDRYKKGGAQLADTFSGAFSTQDTGGSLGQVDVLGSEPLDPADFGFPSKAKGGPGAGVLRRDVAIELERVCRTENPVACVLRFEVPGLPKRPLTAGRQG
jgi:phospholipid/cholesterol/gamma-HCH transport system substrate-binding protein